MKQSLFKNTKFLSLWSSQLLSQTTINLINFLVLVNIYERTNSTIAASFIWVAYGIPALVVGPVAAAVVDLVDRRKAMMVANIIQGLAVLTYALLYQEFLYLSYGVVLAYSLMDQFYIPAETATLPSIVSKKNLAQANGLFFISQQSATIVGFGMAGLVAELIGFGPTLFLGSILLFVAFLAVSRLPRQKYGEIKTHVSIDVKIIDFFERMREGYRFIRDRKTILYPFVFLMWLQVSLAILVVNLPAIGTEVIKTRASLVGILMIAPGGIGALLGTFLVSKLLDFGIRKKDLIDLALVTLSVSFILVSLLIPLFPFWIGRLILISTFVLVGMAYVFALIPSITFLQTHTPKKMMGRLFGNFWFLTTAATLIPVLFSATISDILGVSLLIVLLGLAAGVIFIISKIHIQKTYRTIPKDER